MDPFPGHPVSMYETFTTLSDIVFYRRMHQTTKSIDRYIAIRPAHPGIAVLGVSDLTDLRASFNPAFCIS